MYSSLIPPGTQHVNEVISTGLLDTDMPWDNLAMIGAFLSSFLSDLELRVIDSHSRPVIIELTSLRTGFLQGKLSQRYLRLNCLMSACAPLWEGITGKQWTTDTPLQDAKRRWHMQNETDAIVTLFLGVTTDELYIIYHTQFLVMQRYGQEDLYDADGRKVPKDITELRGKLKPEEELGEEQRRWVHPQSGVAYTFEYPFVSPDHEANLRVIYTRFEKEL